MDLTFKRPEAVVIVQMVVMTSLTARKLGAVTLLQDVLTLHMQRHLDQELN
tara:strand:- start:549 stop:701 length:153 start_codon:yes stop_codon:yes gene_type:complete